MIPGLIVALYAAVTLGGLYWLNTLRLKALAERDFFKTEVADQTKRAEEAEVKTMEANARVERSDRRVGELATAIAPLIEQTDWMTGRWHGQLDTLRQMEQARNANVIVARKALWEIPLVGENARSFDGWTKLPDHKAVAPANTTTQESK